MPDSKGRSRSRSNILKALECACYVNPTPEANILIRQYLGYVKYTYSIYDHYVAGEKIDVKVIATEMALKT